MRTFKDNAGRTWSVTLNVLQMKRIRAQLGIDLVNASRRRRRRRA